MAEIWGAGVSGDRCEGRGAGGQQPGQAAQSVHARKVGGELMMMEMEVAGPKQGGKAGDGYTVWDEL